MYVLKEFEKHFCHSGGERWCQCADTVQWERVSGGGRGGVKLLPGVFCISFL